MGETLTRIRSPREAEQNRLRKLRYRGTCEDCGNPTYGGNGPRNTPRYCHVCSARHKGKALRGTGPLQRRLLDLLENGPMRHSDIAASLSISNGHTSVLLNRMLRYELVERPELGVYQLPGWTP